MTPPQTSILVTGMLRTFHSVGMAAFAWVLCLTTRVILSKSPEYLMTLGLYGPRVPGGAQPAAALAAALRPRPVSGQQSLPPTSIG